MPDKKASIAVGAMCDLRQSSIGPEAPRTTLSDGVQMSLGIVGLVVVLAACFLGGLSPQTVVASASPSPSPTPTVETGPVGNIDQMPLIFVPAGEFHMGAVWTEPDADNEKPLHAVYLDDFWIDQTEVTNAMFAKFVAATGYQTDAEKAGTGAVWTASAPTLVWGANWRRPRGPGSNVYGLDRYPVVQVSWKDAEAYCQWAGRRLPTEAEWEKAARGTDERQYPWGNTPPTGQLANFADRNFWSKWSDTATNDGYRYAAPVGSYPAGASPYGALDMAGNVWEWVNDWNVDTYYQRTPKRNPVGPKLGYLRTVRGGGWFDKASELSVFNRSTMLYSPAQWSDFTGFRCAFSENPPALGEIMRSAPALPAAAVSVTDTSAYLSNITPHAREIFLRGQSLGNTARAFSLVGDSNTDNSAFFAPFDRGWYNLGKYAYLQATIQYFRGSFARHSPAAVGSFSTARVLDPAYAAAPCAPGETPLACEYRFQKPSVALILLGTGDHQDWRGFEGRYRQIIDFTLSKGIIPVLITKADDAEAIFGDAPLGYINGVIERLSAEYNVPLLNLRRVVNTLPDHGCTADGFHYSSPPDGRVADFTGNHLNYGFPVRNLTALQALEALRSQVLTAGGVP